MRIERIGDATLYCGDCREVLPTLDGVDAVVTDPPYGVGVDYGKFDDTPELVSSIIVPALIEALAISKRGAVTPGTRCVMSYPVPAEMGAIYFPAGAGFSRWGFTCFQPILFYGADPDPPTAKRANSRSCTEPSEKNGHPCPKPIKLMEWLVARATRADETVLDPFMGSGTTGVACARLGRGFVGIEIDPGYFDIACRRIEQAQRQKDLFIHPAPPTAKTADMFTEAK